MPPNARLTPASDGFLGPLLSYRYAPLEDKIADPYRTILQVRSTEPGLVTAYSGRSITYNGDPYDVSVMVFAIDPIRATRPGLQTDLTKAVAGKADVVTFNLEGRSAAFFKMTTVDRRIAWLQQTYFVIVAGQDYDRMLQVARALVLANSSETRYKINGQVNARDGTPMEDVAVLLWFADSPCCTSVGPAVYTNPTGRYQVSVAEGTYRISFYPTGIYGFGPTWWKDATDFDTATDLRLSGRNAVGVDAILPSGVLVRGTVRTSAGALREAHVDVFSAATGGWVRAASTNDAGRYALRLAPGRYRMAFSGPEDANFEGRWWRDADRSSRSDVIEVGADDIENIDMTLGKVGSS